MEKESKTVMIIPLNQDNLHYVSDRNQYKLATTYTLVKFSVNRENIRRF